MRKRLAELFFANASNVADKWEQYLGIYDAELSGLIARGQPVRLLEVGVQNGGSLDIWSELLPEGSEIRGIDIIPEIQSIDFKNNQYITVASADATSADELSNQPGSANFDIIIDDASHISGDIIKTFNILFDRLEPGGKYIIEDLHCSYFESHEGGYLRPGSSIEWLKKLVDSVNFDHISGSEVANQADSQLLQQFNRSVARVTFYDSVAVIEKNLIEKTRPYRRLCSGSETSAFPFFDVLSRSPSDDLSLILFTPPTAKKIDETILKQRDEAEQRVLALQQALEQAQEEIAALGNRIARGLATTRRSDREIQTLRRTVAISAKMQEETQFTLAQAVDERDRALRQLEEALKNSAPRGSLLHEFARHSAIGRGLARVRRRAYRLLRTHPVHRPKEWIALRNAQTSISKMGVFSAEYYLRQNPDVANSGLDPLTHFIRFGASELRDPSASISMAEYATSINGPAALLEYLSSSRSKATPEPPGLSIYGQLPAAHEAQIIESGIVDPEFYLRRYPDVAHAGLEPLLHFLTGGLWERRNPNALFDVEWYLATYPDVAASGIPAVLHYVTGGAAEGRRPSNGFDTRWYVERYPDARESGENPLGHYLRTGRQRGYQTVDPNAQYREQVVEEQQTLLFERPDLERHIQVMTIKPSFYIHVEGDDNSKRKITIDSLRKQIYLRYFTLNNRINPFESTENTDPPDYMIWLNAGDVLSERALYDFACAINSNPELDLIYADDDRISVSGRHAPFYKPDWSPDYLECFNYIGRAACFKGARALELLAASSCHFDFLLRFTEAEIQVEHIRRVLAHYPDNLDNRPSPDEAQALEGRLRRTGRIGIVKPWREELPCFDVQVQLPAEPLVSIVIPTAGMTVEVGDKLIDLLMNCLNTIEDKSTYANIEIIIIDNGDLEAERVAELEERGYKRITYNDPVFNVAKKLNIGASIASGEFLLLLNDDIEPLSPDWIERMLEHFAKPHVGVVGAKLVYPDLTLQHAGVVLNHGNPDHVRRMYPREDEGYFYSTIAARNFSAVTGACMMTRADVYRNVGGYTEDLAVSFNDVDYCLKVRERGLTAVYSPRAELIHFESKSRVPSLDPTELNYFADRWASMTSSDPFYNEDSLTIAPPTFEAVKTQNQI